MKKETKLGRKLTINKETITNMEQSQVKGGFSVYLCSNPCPCDTSDDTFWKTCPC
jgi:hypothetical protein